MFQFPSNGKAYTKLIRKPTRNYRLIVSIPFKRESIYKVIVEELNRSTATWSFNSLQTGKHIQSQNENDGLIDIWLSFNSLQTGKHIQSLYQHAHVVREHQEFQFPSNGKAYTKPSKISKRVCTIYSFNSLQTGKHIQSYLRKKSRNFWQGKKFQFPSNGKAYTKSPHFKPSGAVAPEAPKYTRAAHSIFFIKI